MNILNRHGRARRIEKAERSEGPKQREGRKRKRTLTEPDHLPAN